MNNGLQRLYVSRGDTPPHYTLIRMNVALLEGRDNRELYDHFLARDILTGKVYCVVTNADKPTNDALAVAVSALLSKVNRGKFDVVLEIVANSDTGYYQFKSLYAVRLPQVRYVVNPYFALAVIAFAVVVGYMLGMVFNGY